MSMDAIVSTMLAGEPTPKEGLMVGASSRDSEMSNVLDAGPVSIPLARMPCAVPAPVPPGGLPHSGWRLDPRLSAQSPSASRLLGAASTRNFTHVISLGSPSSSSSLPPNASTGGGMCASCSLWVDDCLFETVQAVESSVQTCAPGEADLA